MARSNGWANSERARNREEQLAKEVAALRSGDDWRAYLEVQAKLHGYSPNNTILIALQHAQAFDEGRVPTPEPSMVAGFNTWRSVGRSLGKGQHGYAVLAPCRYQHNVAVDGNGTIRSLGSDEAPKPNERAEKRSVLIGFRIEHVFDISATTGEPLPAPAAPTLLQGQAPEGLGASVLKLIEEHGFSVSTVASASEIGGANGRTNVTDHTVQVRADMDDAAMVKTLLHEAAHVLLHAEGDGPRLSRNVQEIEAESVAFIVAKAHGMATDNYSFPYVAQWATEDHEKTIRSTQDRVANAAKMILEASPADHGFGGKPLDPRQMDQRIRAEATKAPSKSMESGPQISSEVALEVADR